MKIIEISQSAVEENIQSEESIFIEWQSMWTHSRTGVIWKSRDKYLVYIFG